MKKKKLFKNTAHKLCIINKLPKEYFKTSSKNKVFLRWICIEKQICVKQVPKGFY